MRWHLNRHTIIIPKSSNAQRIKENIQVFDFNLNEDEMESISKLDTGKRYFVNPKVSSEPHLR
ncbi:aldo/keto reductase [Bacillus horti]|uniref:aldo/keto reductase n=1 Tax=Caldalkalibacillus horti TaxID=77523 RepID=UPI0027D7724B|nr:aldo/keto reductase [Bacillus horti]